MFIFIFQTIWLFIDDLAGKGLDLIIIFKFLFYLMPNLTEKVLPLTVLLSSILTFGAFAENYEFAAMKASGISLQRSMRTLIVFVSLLGILTFYFANTVIPISEQKIYNLRRNIATLKPAAVITEGVFSDFEGRSIKVDRKYGENDRFLENVVIHEKSNLQKNVTVIKASGGELVSEEGSEIIQLILNDGYYYHDVTGKSGTSDNQFPFAKADFDTYVMNIALPDNMEDLEADRNVETDRMKNVSRLAQDIDSIRDYNFRLAAAFSRNIRNRVGATTEVDTTAMQGEVHTLPEVDTPETITGDSLATLSPDSLGLAETDSLDGLEVDSLDSLEVDSLVGLETDSLVGLETDNPDGLETDQLNIPASETARMRRIAVEAALDSMDNDEGSGITSIPKKDGYLETGQREIDPWDPLSTFKNFERNRLLDASRNSIRNILNSVRGKREELELSYKRYNRHILSLHNKFALALSCIILFFVGAPLGAIIRKGGLGLPMVVAIVLFLAYYFFGVFSNNYAKEGNIPPVIGAWLPTMIMLPLGIWLTRRATADRGLMSFGHFLDIWKERFSLRRKKGKKEAKTT